jgi:hypothetical protein
MAEAAVGGYAWSTFPLPEKRNVVFGKDDHAVFVMFGRNSTPAAGATKVMYAKKQAQMLQSFEKALSEIPYDDMKLRVFLQR